jgi:hypothetical protein
MTQKNALRSLLWGRWITPLDALREIGCLSLSQRVGELRREGLSILDVWVKTRKRVKAYRLSKAAR